MGASRIMWLLGAICACFLAPAAAAEQAPAKIALIIANANYTGNGWPALKNPVKDARLLRETLREAGFEVGPPAVNLRLDQLSERLEAFRARAATLPPKSIAIIYYSGHGIQIDGTNYLVPIGGPSPISIEGVRGPEREEVLSRNFVPLNNMLDAFGDPRPADQAVANILILDACRDNPLDGRTRAAGRPKGLAEVPTIDNVLVAFAAAPGKSAYDGDGENSPYAIALAQELRQRTVPLQVLFTRVTARTLDLTGGEQRPDYKVGLAEVVCLDACDGAAGLAPIRASVSGRGASEARGSAEAATAFSPPSLVRLSGFEVGRFPVSAADWKACVEEAGCSPLRDAPEGPLLPAVRVTWEGVNEYIAWLSAKTGRRWRLPTEEEWRALFGPMRTTRRTASRRLPRFAAAATANAGLEYVGQVLEWTASCADGQGDCALRVAMGVAYDDPDSDLITRSAFPADAAGEKLGFRLIAE